MKRLLKQSKEKLTYPIMENILIENNVMSKDDEVKDMYVDKNGQFNVYIGYNQVTNEDYKTYREKRQNTI